MKRRGFLKALGLAPAAAALAPSEIVALAPEEHKDKCTGFMACVFKLETSKDRELLDIGGEINAAIACHLCNPSRHIVEIEGFLRDYRWVNQPNGYSLEALKGRRAK